MADTTTTTEFKKIKFSCSNCEFEVVVKVYPNKYGFYEIPDKNAYCPNDWGLLYKEPVMDE